MTAYTWKDKDGKDWIYGDEGTILFLSFVMGVRTELYT